MLVKLTPRELQIGMVAVDAIVTPSGQILAPAGSMLTRQLINKAKLYNVPFVFVNVETASSTSELTPIVKPTPVVEPPKVEVPKVAEKIEEVRKPPTHAEETQSNSRRMIVSSEFKGFQVDYLLFIEHLKDVFSKIPSTPNYKIDTKELIEKLSPLYLSRNTITEVFDMIGQMHSINDSVYAHCVNVALISRMIGRWLHFEQHDLDILTCCGLLHDIGKLAIPDAILNKPGKLTDEEFALIKSHPKLGYDMLVNQDVDSRIKQSVLMHHERYDGSGYPNRLTSEFLPDFAMIVAIADVYDAMTAARSYREPLCAFQVIENFERDGYQKYHTKYIYTFLHQIASTYQSNRIMLNDGRSAKIVMLNQSQLSKPIIQFDTGECLDLSTAKDLYISKVL
ncbi:MAG: HD-GYP domain-containing protein [Agathobacter sp.]|nr:HD-GYP domain-containing protein [Agathobacter sp.]